jgi:hypothetical protein
VWAALTVGKPIVLRIARLAVNGSNCVNSRSSSEKTHDGIYVGWRRCLAAKRRVDNSSTDLDCRSVAQIIGCLKNCPRRIHQGCARRYDIQLIENHAVSQD